MSGGSYDHLHSAFDLDDLLRKQGQLGEMADRLAGLGYAKDAALETHELVVILRHMEMRMAVRLARLSKVWRAVEWWDSGDGGEDGVRTALAAYRGETGG
jgi:hypothetical protein